MQFLGDSVMLKLVCLVCNWYLESFDHQHSTVSAPRLHCCTHLQDCTWACGDLGRVFNCVWAFSCDFHQATSLMVCSKYQQRECCYLNGVHIAHVCNHPVCPSMNQEQLTDLVHVTYRTALIWMSAIVAGLQHVLILYCQGVPLAGCGDL